MGSKPFFLSESARRFSDEPAVIAGDCCLTFAELDMRVGQAAARLQEKDLRKWAHIALLSQNDWQSLVVMLAIMRSTAVACPLSVRNPAATLQLQLKTLKCAALVCPAIARRDGIVAFTGETGAAFPGDEPAVQLLESDALAERGNAPRSFRDCAIDPDRPATILFTSGSTREPQPAVHSCANHLANAAAANEIHALGPGDRWLLSLPMYHVGGLAIMFRCLLAGAAIVLPVPGKSLTAALGTNTATHVSLVPTQLKRLLEVSSITGEGNALRCMLLGGAATPDALIEQALARGLPVFKTYGMTETSSQVATVDPGAPREKRFTAGRALSCSSLRVAADGELLVRGDSLFLGYFDGSGTRSQADEQGWFASGDIGHMDLDGYVSVTGRKDSRFISGGENIHPEEIESALLALEQVTQAVVVPVDDKDFGQRPVAFVECRLGKIGDAGLRSSLERTLPRFKIPHQFHPWPVREVTGFKANREDFRQVAARLADTE